MCGIAGLAGKGSTKWIPGMVGAQIHRGPDDAGIFIDESAEIALGMRRLSIVDLEGGRQPMSNNGCSQQGRSSGSVQIVFNGEIYNAPELRTGLEAGGHRFHTSHSDTECLLHLYEDKLEAMLADLNGMFAFVIYDREGRRFFGARDRFGIKPLYYIQSDGRFAFASEVKALLMLPFVKRDIDTQSLYHYLSLRYVPGRRSIFRGIWRVPPGHYFVYDLDRKSLKVERYWRLDTTQTNQRSEEEWCEIIRHELRAAVRRWVLSDVPIACSLSGGIDSTAIVGLLGEMGYPQIRTYTVGFRGSGESEWDETDLARQVSKRWETEHHELILTPDELLQDLIQMVWHLDEPYGGGLPSWYVFKFMSQGVKVGLSGTGGDEVFGAYGRWQRYEDRRNLDAIAAQGKIKLTVQRVASLLPGSVIGKGRKQYYLERFKSYASPFDSYYFYFDDPTKRKSVVGFGLDGLIDTAEMLQQFYDDSGAIEIRNGFTCVDMQTQLAEEFLLMTDRFSMAHSLEARVPFLDHVFVERMLRIPPEVRTRPDNLKYLLKKAVSHLLPEELLLAPKRGFVIPDTLWLRGKLRPLVERLLAPEHLNRQGLIRPEVYTRFVRPHLEGRADFTGQVWTLLMFQLWHVIFIEGATVERPSFSLKDLR